MFWHNEEFAAGLGRDICLDGVVCVVDAVFGLKVQQCYFVSNHLTKIELHSKWKTTV
jgi:hypothetical protein